MGTIRNLICLICLVFLGAAFFSSPSWAIIRSPAEEARHEAERQRIMGLIEAEKAKIRAREETQRAGQREESEKMLKEAREKAQRVQEIQSNPAYRQMTGEQIQAVITRQEILKNAGAPMILMARPFNQVAQVGQKFATEVALSAPKFQSLDTIEIRVAFAPRFVRPVGVFDYPLKKIASFQNEAEISIKEAFLVYSVRLERAVTVAGEQLLIYIVWEALNATNSTSIDLGKNTGLESSVMLGTKNLLESNSLSGISAINSEVQIVSAEALQRPASLHLTDSSALARKELARGSTVCLQMNVPADSPKVGDEFVVEVLVQNPDFVPFDAVSLGIGFDSRKAQVLDWDQGGWLRAGVNVFDGHAHQRFPFNIHSINSVNNVLGKIRYAMGASFTRPMPSGSLVKIRARALEPNASASFILLPETNILSGGVSVQSSKPAAKERS